MKNEDIRKYVKERDKALIELDMEWARKMMPLASNDEIRLLAMHKARIEVTSISEELKSESKEYIRLRNPIL